MLEIGILIYIVFSIGIMIWGLMDNEPRKSNKRRRTYERKNRNENRNVRSGKYT